MNLFFIIVNRQRTTVRGYASLVHEVCCPLTVVCCLCKPKVNNIKTTIILIIAKIRKMAKDK